MPEMVTRNEITQQILEKHGIFSAEQFEALDPSSECMSELYDYFLREMPYGTAKARTGDPYEWISQRVHSVMCW